MKEIEANSRNQNIFHKPSSFSKRPSVIYFGK